MPSIDDHVPVVYHVQDDAVAIEQGHADEWATLCLQDQHFTFFFVPHDCGQVQVEHDGAPIPEHRTAIANEGEVEGTHDVARQCQEAVEAGINHDLDRFPSLVRTYDHKANRGFAIGGHDSPDHSCGTVKRPPSRYAAGYPMRSPYSTASGRFASARFVAARSSSS